MKCISSTAFIGQNIETNLALYDEGRIAGTSSDVRVAICQPIFRVCRQVRTEAQDVFYSLTTFSCRLERNFRERPCFPARFPGFGLCAIQDKIQRFKLKDWEPLAYRDVSLEKHLRSCTGLKHLNIRVAANRYRASPGWQNVSESNVLEKEGDQLQILAQIRGLESLTLAWSSNALGEGQELE